MSGPLFVALALALVLAQFMVPRQLAFVPLLIAVCHFQNLPVLQLGAAFSPCKLVILAGLLRAAWEQRLAWFSRYPLDVAIAVWAVWMVLSGFAHDPKDYNPITIRLSVIWDFAGGYLYGRSFVRNQEAFLMFVRCLAVVLAALALAVTVEKVLQQNLYGWLSGGGAEVTIRGSRVRACGPFSHPILLGTYAATVIPLFASLWCGHRSWALAGIAACGVTVVGCASSGPIMTLASGLLGLALWRWRKSVGRIRTAVVVLFVGLQLAMQAPVWYLMARIDLAGGSTGWHRAELITAALNHIGEWWLVGTDYTRHWIAYGVAWSEYHVDITNYYLYMGVSGGLLLMLAFMAILVEAFRLLGRTMRDLRNMNAPEEFLLWCTGVAIFAHVFTFFSVSYFDQSNAALGLLLGLVPGLCLGAVAMEPQAEMPDAHPDQPNDGEALCASP